MDAGSLLHSVQEPVAALEPASERVGCRCTKTHRKQAWIFGSIVCCAFTILLTLPVTPMFLRDCSRADLERASGGWVAANATEVTELTAYRVAVYNVAFSLPTFLIAGWSGALSDRFGRRNCATLALTGQLLQMLGVVAVARYELAWWWLLVVNSTAGLLGNFFIFLAAAFAFIADGTPPAERGFAFALGDGLLIGVGSLGPAVGGRLVDRFGYEGTYWMCSALIFLSGALFLAAGPSGHTRARPMRWRQWARSFTPLLLLRAFQEDAKSGTSWAYGSFFCFISALTALPPFFNLYAAQVLGWGSRALGDWLSAHCGVDALCILLSAPLARWLCGRTPRHLEMLRVTLGGVPLFAFLLYLLPREAVAYYSVAALPLFGVGFCSVPAFRALFSCARDASRQGEQLALIAAIEALPGLFATPASALLFRSSLDEPQLTFAGLGALALLAWLIVLFLVRDAGRVKPVEAAEAGGR